MDRAYIKTIEHVAVGYIVGKRVTIKISISRIRVVATLGEEKLRSENVQGMNHCTTTYGL